MYCVLSPSVEILWFTLGGQLICIEGDLLHFFRPKKCEIEYHCIHKSDINYIYSKNRLLSAELDFHFTQNDTAMLLKTEYNSVRDELYAPVKSFLRGQKRHQDGICKERRDVYFYLKDQNFKLMNLSMHAYDYAPSISHIFQPQIRIKSGLFWKKITQGMLYILTENELIAMEDIEYGTSYYYIQRKAMREVSLQNCKPGYCLLNIAFKQSALGFYFSYEQQKQMQALADILNNK
jgi:hypothetical protein